MTRTPEEIAKAVALEEAKRINLPAGTPVAEFLKIAADSIPELYQRDVRPKALVQPKPAPQLPLRFTMQHVADGDSLGSQVLYEGDSICIDFGEHLTGYLSFRVTPTGSVADSPIRLRLTFGEVPTDVAEAFYPYKGWISSAWLPDEVITVDDLPTVTRLTRRHAFRYVKLEVLAASRRFGLCFDDVIGHSVTSANSPVALLPSFVPEWIRKVDHVSQITLRDCLQTCFEDGPRRDRRLWVGDLRLQALVNYETFGANNVVKRCLYMFAGLPRSDGLVNGCVYERPVPTYADTTTLDYAALYCVTLQEYVQATGDLETGIQLWPVAVRQLEVILARLDANGLFQDNGETWCFIDWAFDLEKSAATHAVIVFALRRMVLLALQIGESRQIAWMETAIERMVNAARMHLFDTALGVYVSGPHQQVSIATQAWMVLAEVPESTDVAQAALRTVMASKDAVKPITPYLYHYIAEAMLTCDMRQEALDLIRSYWGAMLDAGADTFWEAFDPENPLTSPYGDIHVNSFCHAWSCSPSWFFRAKRLGCEAE